MPGNVWKWPPPLCMLCSFSRENLLTLGKSILDKTIQRNCELLWNRGWLHGFIQDFLSTCKWVPVSTWQLSFGFLLTVSLWLLVHLCGSATQRVNVYGWWIGSYLQDISDWLVVSAGLLCGEGFWCLVLDQWEECCGWFVMSATGKDWTVEGYMLSICILPMHFRYDRRKYMVC